MIGPGGRPWRQSRNSVMNQILGGQRITLGGQRISGKGVFRSGGIPGLWILRSFHSLRMMQWAHNRLDGIPVFRGDARAVIESIVRIARLETAEERGVPGCEQNNNADGGPFQIGKRAAACGPYRDSSSGSVSPGSMALVTPPRSRRGVS
jgi:hypothetical protein